MPTCSESIRHCSVFGKRNFRKSLLRQREEEYPTEAVIIPRGSFYQTTGGAWIYVLAPEGDKAYKRPIRIGRQNPQYYEVLDGLEPGERVIVSGYENYGSNDVLILNK